MAKSRVRRTVSINDELYDEMDELLDAANVLNRNEFIEKAVRFYIGFLTADLAETYLLTTYNTVLQGTIGRSEDRISRLLYKLSVEVAMQNRIDAVNKNLSEEEMDIIRQKAEEEVREIIGYWRRK